MFSIPVYTEAIPIPTTPQSIIKETVLLPSKNKDVRNAEYIDKDSLYISINSPVLSRTKSMLKLENAELKQQAQKREIELLVRNNNEKREISKKQWI